MSNPRTPGCDSEENEFAKQGGITNGAAWSVFSFFSFSFCALFVQLQLTNAIAIAMEPHLVSHSSCFL